MVSNEVVQRMTNEVIAEAMRARGMSCEELAATSGVSAERLALAVHNRVTLKADEFMAICKPLGLSVRDFATGAPITVGAGPSTVPFPSITR